MSAEEHPPAVVPEATHEVPQVKSDPEKEHREHQQQHPEETGTKDVAEAVVNGTHQTHKEEKVEVKSEDSHHHHHNHHHQEQQQQPEKEQEQVKEEKEAPQEEDVSTKVLTERIKGNSDSHIPIEEPSILSSPARHCSNGKSSRGGSRPIFGDSGRIVLYEDRKDLQECQFMDSFGAVNP